MDLSSCGRPLAKISILPVMISRLCSHCGCLFGVCPSCFRGASYCSRACSRAGRKRVVRAADRRYRGTVVGRRKRAMQASRRRARFRKRKADVDSVGDLGSRSRPGGDDGTRGDHSGAPSPAAVPAEERLSHDQTVPLCSSLPILAWVAACTPQTASPGVFVCRRCGATTRHVVSVADHFARRDRDRARTSSSPRGPPSSRWRRP